MRAAACSGARSRLIQYDTQSDIALYTKFAQQLAREDKVDVVHGGITSAFARGDPPDSSGAATRSTSTTCCTRAACAIATCVVTGTTPAQAVRADRRARDEDSGATRSTSWRPTTTTGQITAKWLAALHSGSAKAPWSRPTSSRSTWPTSARPSPRSSRRSRPGWSPRWWAARTCLSTGSGRPRG